MIENIRSYTGLIFVVIVLLLAGFILMDSQNLMRSPTQSTYITVDGTGYTYEEFMEGTDQPMRLTQALGEYSLLFTYFRTLAIGAQTEDERYRNIFASRMIIRDAAKEYGVYPSDEEVNEYIRNMGAFQTRPPIGAAPGTPGEFDQETYNNFIEKNIKNLGMNEEKFLCLNYFGSTSSVNALTSIMLNASSVLVHPMISIHS